MHIKSVSIKNVRSIEKLEWAVSEENAAGWHVIIGDNGAGKSAVVRSIALALVGPRQALALRQDWNTWLRIGTEKGSIKLNLLCDKAFDKVSSSNEKQPPLPPNADIGKQMHEEAVQREWKRVTEFPSVIMLVSRTKNMGTVLGWHNYDEHNNAFSYVWGESEGWFSAGYGAIRRFQRGDGSDGSAADFTPDLRLARHLGIFQEDTPLIEGLRWLRELKFKELEGEAEGQLLKPLIRFVNEEDFLPFGVRLENVSSKGVEFSDGNGNRVSVEELSAGYRSILSMTFDLIRHLALAYGHENIFSGENFTTITVPGVVLIDEVDAHLHPTWQRRIGLWFRKHFPNIQFIVTTHSPLVCQAAEHGTVFKLPTPGTDETGRMIAGVELDRLRYGNVLDAYSTGAFGADVTRSDTSKQMSQKLAELNHKDFDEGLTQKEKKEQERLRSILPTAAYAERKGAGARK